MLGYSIPISGKDLRLRVTYSAESLKPGTRLIHSQNTWKYEIHWYWQNLKLFYALRFLSHAVLGFWTIKNIEIQYKTLAIMACFTILGGLGITIGYHRLWSHRSYEACISLRYFLAFMAGGMAQWDILWWASHHRAHHKFTDTDLDPYNARRGFLFSHIGWIVGYDPGSWGRVDISDLQADPVVIWQHQYYVPIAVISGYALPSLFCYLGWGDWQGGLLYAGLIRVAVTSQVASLVNSVAHSPWAGSQPYSGGTTARHAPWLFIALGEGNHNFHHTFPKDYRNGYYWYESDLSKVILLLLAKVGLVWNLHDTEDRDIEMARLRQQGFHEVSHHHSSPELAHLERMYWDQYVNLANSDKALICINGIVYNVTDFIDEHPGGSEMIKKSVGLDATSAFYGGHNDHSPKAEALLATMAVAIIKDRGQPSPKRKTQ